MPEGPVFYNNDERLGSEDRNLSNSVKLGDGLIKVYQDTGEDRVLAVSLVEESLVVQVDLDYNLARVGGIPLSVSVCSDSGLNPSGVGIGIFHALDVIIFPRADDIIDDSTVPSKPVVNGVEVGVSKIDDIYYLKAYQVSASPTPTGVIHFGGVPMSYGSENELIIRDSGYTISDVNRYETLNFFGVPIRVGYVDAENKYYLIVDVSGSAVAQYKMNDNVSTTNVVNKFGTDGTYNGQNTIDRSVTGKINGALSFTGSPDYIDTNQTFTTTFQDSFSINLWVKPDDAEPGSSQCLFGVNNGANDRCRLFFNGTDLSFDYYAGVGFASTFSGTHGFIDDVWSMVTLTVFKVDNSSLRAKIYVDNVEIEDSGDHPISMPPYSSVRDLFIGAYNDNNTDKNHFAGDIDNFCIFDKVLTEDNIDFLYHSGAGTEDLSN